MTTPLISTILPTFLEVPFSDIGLLKRDCRARRPEPPPEDPDPSQAPGNDVPVAVAPQLLLGQCSRHTGGVVEASAVRGDGRGEDGHAGSVVAPRRPTVTRGTSARPKPVHLLDVDDADAALSPDALRGVDHREPGAADERVLRDRLATRGGPRAGGGALAETRRAEEGAEADGGNH